MPGCRWWSTSRLPRPRPRLGRWWSGREGLGVLITAFMNRRWDSDQLTLRRLLDEGKLGEVLRYESRLERWRPALSEHEPWREVSAPEAGGGVLLDLGSHLVDQALVLFGPVVHVYAEVESRRGGVADDDVFLALEHRSGARESPLGVAGRGGAGAAPARARRPARATSSPTSTGRRMRCAQAPGRAATRSGASSPLSGGAGWSSRRDSEAVASERGLAALLHRSRAGPPGGLTTPGRSLGRGYRPRGARRRSAQRGDGRSGSRLAEIRDRRARVWLHRARRSARTSRTPSLRDPRRCGGS